MLKRSKKKKVKFKFSSRKAKEIFLCGDFNNWCMHDLPMKKAREDSYEIEIQLLPGEYEYKFLVDGIWYNDPVCMWHVANVWGSENSVIKVE